MSLGLIGSFTGVMVAWISAHFNALEGAENLA